ncbi:MAG: flavodoxin family protein [Lachnospiraceae bacterium]|nr:flavodoxin family protein [Lachnospiraceae bacterium]
MNKNVLLLLGSPRKNGNTSFLASEFARGAKENGAQVESVFLREKEMKDCLGCGVCQQNGGSCIQKDDMEVIYQQMRKADVIVFATPVYFYSWTSYMKRLIDRTFAVEKLLENKTFCLLCAGAATEESYMQTLCDSYEKYISCFRGEGNRNGGVVIACGTNMPKDTEGSEAAEKAYQLGKKLA